MGSLLLAVLDSVAIALVLPLADLATSPSGESPTLRRFASVIGDVDPSRLTAFLVMAVVLLFILKNLGGMAFQWWLQGFVFRERVRTSSNLLRHFLSSPYTLVSQRSSAELLRTMDASVVLVFGSVVTGLMQVVSFGLTILALAVMLLLVAPIPSLVLCVYFGGAAWIYLASVRPRAVRAGELSQRASLDGWRAALSALGALKEVSLRGAQEKFVKTYSDAQLRGAHAGRTMNFLSALPRYFLEVLFVSAVAIVVFITSTAPHLAGNSLPGLLTLFVAAGFRILPSITGLLGSVSMVRSGTTAVNLVATELESARRQAARPVEEGPPIPFHHDILLRDITFHYPGTDVPVLERVTLTLRRGTSIAVVGGSGAGKTTLIDIILGLHQPTSGSILVDGLSIADQTARWQRGISYVPQDVFILDASLRENILFDVTPDDEDEEMLHRVCDAAALNDFVRNLPEGLDTQIGERGARLSGGQKQRLGIARALYRGPSLLVLDEATSALDNATERKIMDFIGSLHGEVTVVVVAHRLSTIRNCDQVVFLRNGRVASQGSFEEVERHLPEFRNLVRLGSLESQASAEDSG